MPKMRSLMLITAALAAITTLSACEKTPIDIARDSVLITSSKDGGTITVQFPSDDDNTSPVLEKWSNGLVWVKCPVGQRLDVDTQSTPTGNTYQRAQCRADNMLPDTTSSSSSSSASICGDKCMAKKDAAG